MSASADVAVTGHETKYARTVQLRYNYRLYPTLGQQVALARAFGCARVVFNDGLRARQEAFAAGLPYISDAELSARLTAMKKTLERAWLTEVSSVVLQQALVDLNAAYRNFFASVSGTRKGPKIAPPRFRSRKDRRQAIRFTSNARFRVLPSGKLRLPKVGDVHVRWSRPLPSGPSSVTLTKDPAGRYVASFVVETEPGALPETQPVLGIDLGLAHADARRDFHHKLSTSLIRENQAVAVEDLAVRGLARTRMAKSVHDAGWSGFVAMLEYKARLYGRKFHRIGRFEPTSQMCSVCGVKDGPKPLHVRIWQCQGCGVSLDRDVNAAVNVARAAGLAVTACGAQVRPGPALAQCGEAGTHPKPRREPV